MTQRVERTGGLGAQRPAGGFRGIPFGVFAFFLLFYFLTNAGWYQVGDERIMLATAKQILGSGQLGFALQEPLKEHEDDVVKGKDGLYYFKYGLGQSLVELPFLAFHSLVFPRPSRGGMGLLPSNGFLQSEMLTVFLCPSILSALGCVLVYLFALRLKISRRSAFLVSMTYGLCTMVWPYAKSLMAETTLNVAVLGGLFAGVSYKSTARRYWLLIAGACLGFALITKTVSVLVIPILVTYLLAGVRPVKRTVLETGVFMGLPLAAFAALQLWHNDLRYGSLWELGYSFGWDRLGFSTPLTVGLWGLLLSPGKSFFLYSPIALLGVVAFRDLFQKNRAEALLFLGVVLVILVPHACWWAWSGDWAWGPRFLLILVPYVMLPVGYFFNGWAQRRRLFRNVVLGLVAVSVAVQVIGVTADPFAFLGYRSQWISELTGDKIYKPLPLLVEGATVNFNPMFSHIFGNIWLIKHTLFSYDLWSDPPWKSLERLDLMTPKEVYSSRLPPFWWPVAFPWFDRFSAVWVYPFAAAILLAVIWLGLALWRSVKRESERVGACLPRA